MTSKTLTVSTRIPVELGERLGKLNAILGVDKTVFLKACIENFCKSNRILLDHWDKKQEYIAYVKKQLGTVPHQKMRFINGNLDKVSEAILVVFADELAASSEKVWKELKKIDEKYESNYLVDWDVSDETDDTVTLESEREKHNLLDIDVAITILAGVQRKFEFDEDFWDSWTDIFEEESLLLLIALKQAFDKHGATAIIDEALKEQESKYVEVDASGKLSRSGLMVKLPIKFNGGK